MLGITRPRRIAVLVTLALASAGIVTGVVQAATTSDFAVTASPSVATAPQNGSATWTVTASTADGFDGDVAFTVAGAPVGVEFAPLSLDLGPATSRSGTLTATVGSTAKAGIYPLVITGTSGAVSHSAAVTLRVRGFTVTLTPATRSVAPGTSTSYSIAVQGFAGFTGTVNLTQSGLPGLPGALVSLTNASRVLNTTTTSYTATLSVATTALQALGNFPFTVTGTSGVIPQQVANGALVVAPRSVSVAALPTSRVVVKGGPAGLTAGYPLTITRFFTTGTATLSFPSPLPSGVSGTFTPATVASTASSSTLNLTVSTAAVGRYTIPIRVVVGSFTGSSSVTLVVEQQGDPFQISGPVGTLQQLAPDVSLPLDLVLTNPNPVPINVSALTVTVGGTSNEAACSGLQNYEAVQFSGAYPLVLPANSSRSLEDLGVPQGQWPKVRMKNLPVNQDGCKGVTVNLQYSGTANGGETA